MIELAGIIILGIFAQWLAWKIRVPAILPLILFGLAVGPLSTFYTHNGEKLIEPIFNQATGHGLFPGKSLFYFVSLAIGIILFEGGLTLRRKEISEVGPSILRLITYGSVITFIGAGLAAHFIMGLNWSISFLFAGLIIVTGPTVIAPILQNIPLNRNVSTVLKWEGILIDPIGAFVAVLVFEFIHSAEGGMAYTSHAFITFVNIGLIGLALGAIAGYSLYIIIKRDLVPHYLLNVFTLAFVLMIFVFSDILAHESGLLSVVVMGTVMANLDVPNLKEILSFKESLSVLLISILFILLSANINPSDLQLLIQNWRPIALFSFVALILRPLSVFLSTHKGGLSFAEKLFIGWVGPRGIVAAGIASLFGITLTSEGVEGAEYITPLVFMIVLGTVLLNATTARLAARWLGVIQDDSTGVLILGANPGARLIGQYLQGQGRHVVLIDNNARNIQRAVAADLEAYEINIYTDDLKDQFELLDMAYLLAMTASVDVNQHAIDKYHKIFGEKGAFRLLGEEEMKQPINQHPDSGIFSYSDDYLNINEAVRDHPNIFEVPATNPDELQSLLKQMEGNSCTIPIFIKYEGNRLEPLPKYFNNDNTDKMLELVYLGKKLEPVLEVNG